MVEIVFWFMSLGLLVVLAQLVAGVHELTLQRRSRMHVTEPNYERETLWGAL